MPSKKGISVCSSVAANSTVRFAVLQPHPCSYTAHLPLSDLRGRYHRQNRARQPLHITPSLFTANNQTIRIPTSSSPTVSPASQCHTPQQPIWYSEAPEANTTNKMEHVSHSSPHHLQRSKKQANVHTQLFLSRSYVLPHIAVWISLHSSPGTRLPIKQTSRNRSDRLVVLHLNISLSCQQPVCAHNQLFSSRPFVLAHSAATTSINSSFPTWSAHDARLANKIRQVSSSAVLLFLQ